MRDELIIHGEGLDQSLPLDIKSVDDVFSPIDSAVDAAILRQDIGPVMELGRSLISNIKLHGLALARLLYKLHLHWEMFGLEDTFQARIMDEWGLSSQTISKYINVIKSVFENKDIPADEKPLLAEKPMRTLIRLVGPANDGRLDTDDWKALARAADDREVTEILTPRKTSTVGRPGMILLLYSDGTLEALEGNDRCTVGLLRSSPRDLKNPLRAKALERLTRSAHILEKE